MYMQAKAICTHHRAARVVVGLTAASLAAQGARFVLRHWYVAAVKYTVGLYGVVLLVVVPLTVLIVNILVVRETRRASSHAAETLGVLRSTTVNFSVPTVVLLSTSFIYVLLTGPHCVLGIVDLWIADTGDCTTNHGFLAAWALMQPIYAYNFFVYVIAGHRFRFELRQLFYCCCEDSSRAVSASSDAIALNERHEAAAHGVV